MDEPAASDGLANQYSGIAGWLAFLTLGVILTPIALAIAVKNNLASTQYSEMYHNSWLIPTYIIWDVFYLVIYCICAYLILKRR